MHAPTKPQILYLPLWDGNYLIYHYETWKRSTLKKKKNMESITNSSCKKRTLCWFFLGLWTLYPKKRLFTELAYLRLLLLLLLAIFVFCFENSASSLLDLPARCDLNFTYFIQGLIHRWDQISKFSFELFNLSVFVEGVTGNGNPWYYVGRIWFRTSCLYNSFLTRVLVISFFT